MAAVDATAFVTAAGTATGAAAAAAGAVAELLRAASSARSWASLSVAFSRPCASPGVAAPRSHGVR